MKASERVQCIASRLSNDSGAAVKLGMGAGGDRTMVVDKETEDAVLEVFEGVGDSRLVTEERGELGPRSARWSVVIDPIDGSSNFERRVPFYCTSIAVAEGQRLGDVKYGLVRNLVSGETYYAERGEGATINGRAISTSHARKVQDAVMTIDMCRSTARDIQRVTQLISSAKRQAHFGANALELCLVAEGKLDGFVDIRGRMRITDFAAGYLIAKEAGALVTNLEGGTLNPRINLAERFRVVAAANGTLHRAILKLLGA